MRACGTQTLHCHSADMRSYLPNETQPLSLHLAPDLATAGIAHHRTNLSICRMALVLAGVTFVALSGLRGVSPDDAGASDPDVTAGQALAGILLTLLSQFVGAHLHAFRPACSHRHIIPAVCGTQVVTVASAHCMPSRSALTCTKHPCAAAGQMILEELLLGDVHLHPYELLGWEGLFGTVFMLGISLPVVGMIPGASVCA